MANKMSEKEKTIAVVRSLLTDLAKVRKEPTEENIFELVGGLIYVNKNEYNNEVVNQTIRDTIREVLKIKPDQNLYEEILISYVSQMEARRNQLSSKDDDVDSSFDEIKNEIEDTIILFYENDLVSLEFIQQEALDSAFVRNTKLMKAWDKGKISKEKVADFIGRRRDPQKAISGKKDEKDKYTRITEIYYMLKRYPENRKISEKYLDLLPKKEALRLYVEGKLEGKDLKKISPKVEDLFMLEANQILTLLQEKHIPGMRSITQEEILSLYGIKLSGQELIELSEKRRISEEKIIILAANNAVQEIDETKTLKPEEFLEFYNAERLLRLAKENKINSRFVEILNENILAKLPKEKQEEYYAKIISDIRMSLDDNGLRTTETSLELFKLGILPSQALKDNIESLDSDISILTVLENSVDEETIAKLFNENAISVETIKDIYLADEIIDLYNKGILSSRAILAIPEEERNIYLDVNIDEGADETKTILELYTKYDGIEIQDVVRLLKDKVQAEEIFANLDRQNLSKEKIRQLFINYLISQDELGKLRDEGLITIEDYEKYSNDLGKAEFFEKLKKTKFVKATGQETPGTGNGGTRIKGDGEPKKEKISFETRREVLETLGGDTATAIIYGNDKSFNGYSIVGFAEDGLVVFENFEKARNATYIMTYQQAAYFMENVNIANSVLNEDSNVNYTGTKTELRDTENVRRKLHSKCWAKNVTDAISELSVEARDRIKPNGRYLEDVKKVMKKSREEYERD